VASVAAATATHSVLALGLSVVLARVLGPAGRGSYALLTLAALMAATLGTLGYESAAVFILGRDRGKARAVLAASIFLAVAAGAAVSALLVWAGAGPRPWLPAAARGLTVVAAAAVPFLLLSILLNGILVGLGRVSVSAWLGTGSVALSLVLTSLASLAPVDRLGAVVWAFTAAAVAQAAAPFVLVTRAVGGPLVDPRPALAGGVGYSLTAHASTVLHMLHLRADVFLMSLFLGPREIGLYALAQAVCEWVWLLPRSAASVLFPVVAGADMSRALSATTRTCRVAFSLAGVGALGLGLVAGWLIPVIFGEAFRDSVPAIRLLLPGIWLGSIAGSLSSFLAGRGRPEFPLLTSLVSLSFNVLLNLTLVPRFGIAGAAVSSAASYSMMTAINTVLSRRLAALPVRELVLLQNTDFRLVWREVRTRWQALSGRP
jgi:O-antigen/teichoic acid export membrane protein